MTAGIYCFNELETPLPSGELVVGWFGGEEADELAVYGALDRELSVWRSDSGGTFAKVAEFDYPPPWDTSSAAVGWPYAADVRGDAKDEFVIARGIDGTILSIGLDPQGDANPVLDEGFGTLLGGLALFDVSGDAKRDVVAWGEDPEAVSAWLNDGAGNFTPSLGAAPNSLPCGAVASAHGTFGGIEQLAVLTAPCGDEPQPLRLVAPSGSDLVETAGPTVGRRAARIAVGDLDGDGLDDVVTFARADAEFQIFSGDGVGLAEPVPIGSEITCPHCTCLECNLAHGLAIGNLDGNPEQDIVALLNEDGYQRILVGLNPGSSSERWYELAADAQQVLLANLDDDGLHDIILGRPSGVTVLMSNP